MNALSALRRLVGMLSIALLAPLLFACASDSTDPMPESTGPAILRLGAIPDQDPEKLQRLHGALSEYLADELSVEVSYVPVTDYAAAVSAFAVGDLDLVWFGGLTGVQARLQAEGARAIAQRDIDAEFHSVFIANAASGLEPLADATELNALVGRTFTFGSESSTSGRLMPQHFLQEAGITLDDFSGQPGFSGSHDATIQLVEAGSYDAGVLNEQVWRARLEAGEVDAERVIELWRTPAYYDYHWVIREDVEDRLGEGLIDQVQGALLALDGENPEHAEILDLFGADAFIETEDANYAQIEAVGRAIGRIQD